MKNFIVGFVLIACINLNYVQAEPKVKRVNMDEHGYDGELFVDPKTGLLQPPLRDYSINSADQLTLGGQYSDLYCKVLDSGSVFHTRYWKNYCKKDVDGVKVDLCCQGRTCIGYGMLTGLGGYCELNSRIEKD